MQLLQLPATAPHHEQVIHKIMSKLCSPLDFSFPSPAKLLNQAEVVRSTVDQQREFSASQAQLIQQQIHRQSSAPQFQHQVDNHLPKSQQSLCKIVILTV